MCTGDGGGAGPAPHLHRDSRAGRQASVAAEGGGREVEGEGEAVRGGAGETGAGQTGEAAVGHGPVPGQAPAPPRAVTSR